MARRAPSDEKPFRPLDASILSAVVQHAPEERGGTAPSAPKISERLEPSASPHPPILAIASSPAPATAIPLVQRLDQEKRILFTREETQALDRLVNNLAVRLRAQVKVSHILRALTTLLLHSETQIDQRAGERGTLTRPPNGDYAALQRFERELAVILAHALRDTGPPR